MSVQQQPRATLGQCSQHRGRVSREFIPRALGPLGEKESTPSASAARVPEAIGTSAIESEQRFSIGALQVP